MIAHSKSKRAAKAMPQVESTILVEHTDAKIIKCTARKSFTVGNASVKEGETFFLVKSERRAGRYYIVKFNEARATYQCSCGANCCEHDHTSTVREYVMSHVVVPAAVAKAEKSSALVEAPTPMTMPLTAAQWREIMKRDKVRQKAEKAREMAKIEEARAQARRELAATG